MNKRGFFILLILFFSLNIFGDFSFNVSAQSSAPVCEDEDELDDSQKKLCDDLREIEKEEKEVQATLNIQKGKTATVEREVNILTGEIKSVQLSINKKNLLISNLGNDIALKDQTVSALNQKIENGKKSIVQLIRKTNEMDNVSLTEILLAHENISDFFVEADEYFLIQDSLENLFAEIREIRGLTEEEKIKLEQKKKAELDLKSEIENQKKNVQVKESEKKNILALSKQTELTYEQILAEKRAKAASIRAALFKLRDSAGISFGDALKYAQESSKKTGVRASFIMAILKQESDLGNNVGACNLANDAPEYKWDRIMPGPEHYANYVANGKSCTGAASPCSWRDDQSTFKEIASKLGLDYSSTPLSCPIRSVSPWGGAMGPSQFIPTTWKSYESRIAQTLGVSTPNPWNPEHAFMATALYLQDLGAAGGGYSAEHTAAAKYYAGSNYSSGPGQSYGTSVMGHTASMQQQIDFLGEVN